MPGRVTAPGFLLHGTLLHGLSGALHPLLRFRNVGSFGQNGQWTAASAQASRCQTHGGGRRRPECLGVAAVGRALEHPLL
jgi:hypothetical protein